MKTIFVSGSYDILNVGHIRSFNDLVKNYTISIGSMADEGRKEKPHIIVGLNTDRLMMNHKGRVIIPFDQRKEILLALRDVDEVIACDNPSHLEIVKKYNIDVYATVDEWLNRQKETIDWVTSNGGEVFHLKYYPEDGEILSSSQIRRRVIEAGS